MRRWRGDDMPPEALPSRPSLDQLRRRAKELRDAARAGDPVALARITAHTPGIQAGAVTLAAAQLAVAREHGSPSWPQLVAEVRARTAELGQRVDEFLVASIRDWTGRAARMLARDPWIAGYDFRTAVILGDAARVRQMLAGDPGLATRPDERTGWTALHAACASRWHRLDPARADGLTEVARQARRAGTGCRCCARSRARRTRPLPGCCWSTGPGPMTTCCTWPRSKPVMHACGCCCRTRRASPPPPRCPRRSAPAT